MNDIFHKFPHTPHLAWLGTGAPREDKLLTAGEARAFLEGAVVVEEKVDGANLGFSVGPDGRIRAQSRGHYLSPSRCHAQWRPLWAWLAQRGRDMAEALGGELMLYGEWTHALHTIPYSALPDWFLLFDVHEPANGHFWSVDRRNALATKLGIRTVPEVFRGRVELNQVSKLIGISHLGSPRMEGIYLRREDAGLLIQRAKIVGTEFKQQIEEHWTRRALVTNRMRAAPNELSRS